MAYVDSSPLKQIGFSKIFASIYRPNERKLFVSAQPNRSLSIHRSPRARQILVARRWFDDTIELVNTEVEFDDDSLNELARNHLNMISDIEANLKLFLTTRWQHAKKLTLPAIFDFDERDEVSPPMAFARTPACSFLRRTSS